MVLVWWPLYRGLFGYVFIGIFDQTGNEPLKDGEKPSPQD
jgi:hypothetical protein